MKYPAEGFGQAETVNWLGTASSVKTLVTEEEVGPHTTVTVKEQVAFGETPLAAVAVTVVVPLGNTLGGSNDFTANHVSDRWRRDAGSGSRKRDQRLAAALIGTHRHIARAVDGGRRARSKGKAIEFID